MTCLFVVCFALLAVLLITGFGTGKNVAVEVPTDGASLADLVDSVIDSVVTVVVAKDGGTGFGSGFVYTDDGYIITNYHVIAGAKSQYWTVSIGLFNMLEKEYVEVWFVRFCAGAVLVSIPIAILYLLTQKMYQEAMGGAVKG